MSTSATVRKSENSRRSLLKENAGKVVSYRHALYQTMENALANDDRVMIFGQGVDDHKGIFGTTIDLHKKYGKDRVFDTPLSEEGMTGIAVGAALNGIYPIHTHIRVDFALLAMNQIVNLAAKYRYMSGGKCQVPMLMRMIIGRSWGQGSQHSQSLQSLFAHIPGLTVIMPSSAQSVLEMYPHLIENYPNPVVSIEHRLLYDLEFNIPASVDSPQDLLGSRKLREGKDVTIVATSIMAIEALRGAEYLKQFGIQCDVIDLNCVSHPDTNMVLESVQKTGRLVVVDTSWIGYGVCAEISRIICEKSPQSLKAPVVNLGMKPAPCPTAKSLEDLYYPNLQDMVGEVARLVKGSRTAVPLPDATTTVESYRKFKGPF